MSAADRAHPVRCLIHRNGIERCAAADAVGSATSERRRALQVGAGLAKGGDAAGAAKTP